MFIGADTEGIQAIAMAPHERARVYIAGNGVPARLLRRTLRQVGANVEIGRGAMPPEAPVGGYPEVVFATQDGELDTEACVTAWSRVDGVAVIAFQPTEITDRLRLFDAGADDVWALDITPEEAGARLRALLRRLGRGRQLQLTDGRRTVAITRNDLMVDGVSLRMTRIRHHLLFVLAENHPHTTGHDELIEKVWGYQVVGDEPGFVQTQVSRLRRELDQAGLPDLVRTARGVGYGICPQFVRSARAF